MRRTAFTHLLLGLLTPLSAAQWYSDEFTPTRSGVGVAAVDDLLLIAGGENAGTDSAVVNIFDVSTRTWSTDALTLARTLVASGSVGSEVLFAGGCIAQQQCTDRVDLFDASTGTWSTDALSAARWEIGVATTDRFAVFAGGAVPDPSTGSNMVSPAVDIYDAVTMTWSTTQLPAARRRLQGASVGTRVYFGGGLPASNTVNVFDTATGTWSELSLPLGRNHSAMSIASVGPLLLFAGGHQGVSQDTVDIYDTALGTWSSAALSAARSSAGSVTSGDRVLFAGGFDESAEGTSPVVDIFDAPTRTWRTSTMSMSRGFVQAASASDIAFLVGGTFRVPSGFEPSNTVDCYERILGNTYCQPALPNSTGQPGRIMIGGAPVAGSELRIAAIALPANQLTIFFAGSARDLRVPPGSTGVLCVGGQSIRLLSPGQAPHSGPNGEVNILVDTAGLDPITFSSTWNFQGWYRDWIGGPTSNFTQAIELTFFL